MSFKLNEPESGVKVVEEKVLVDEIKLTGIVIQLRPNELPAIKVRWAKGHTNEDGTFVIQNREETKIEHPISTELISKVVTPGNTRAQEVEKAAFEYLYSTGKISAGEVE